MFQSLSEKLANAFKKFRSKGKLTASDVKEGMREIKLALLEADVNFKVVRDFIKTVSERAVGAEVLESLLPAQQVVKIVNEELINLMGKTQAKLEINPKPPTVIMMVGLQGAGKTTHSGKLAGLYKKQGKNIINIAKTGSIGGLYGIIFTKKKCFVLAKECKSKTEFMKKYWTAYVKSLKYGWIEQYKWFKRPISYRLKWTYDVTLREAKKYNTGSEFRIKNKGAYQAAVRNGWLKDYGWMRIKNTKVKNMIVEFYKENLDFPLSGGDTFSNNNRKSIRRILNVLKNYIGKKTNVKVNINDKHKILISNLINFCKLEGIDYNQILEIEVIQNGETFQIIVNKGTNENVQILEID